MKFRVLPRTSGIPNGGRDTVYLAIDNWNDFSFVTLFHMTLHDERGELHDIGNIKIGFAGQTIQIDTYSKLPSEFEIIGVEYFSLGQSVDFYRNIGALPNGNGKKILTALRDIVAMPALIDVIKEEEVFSTSLLRTISLSIIKGQFARVFEGKAALTNFKFKYIRNESDRLGSVDLLFEVKESSKPSTNIHAIIGRNGVGKTTLLNGMIESITDRQSGNARFVDAIGRRETTIATDYFSSLVSVSFSAFDPFTPPQEQADPAKGTCYFYIGLKDATTDSSIGLSVIFRRIALGH